MNVEILSAARPTSCQWTARFWTLSIAAMVLLATRSSIAQTSFSVGTNLVDISQQKGNETDPFIAINPLNPSNMVVAAASDGTNGGLFFAFTTNMGGTWTSNFVATNLDSQGLSPAAGPDAEPSVAFDVYNNLYLAYLPTNFLGVAIAVSTNGGQTFSSLTNLAALDVTDQPRITSPIAGTAAGSVWVVYKDYTTVNAPLQVQAALATGPGAFGAFGTPAVVPGSTNGGFADIAVGPLGEVLVTYQDNLSGSPDPFTYPTANIWVSLETNPIAGSSITNRGFKAPVLVASNAIGGVTYIDAAPSGIGINATPGLAWNFDSNSTNFDNLYLIYTSVGTNGNAVIGFLSTRDKTTNIPVSTNIFTTNLTVTIIATTNIVLTNGGLTNLAFTNIATTNITLTNIVTTNVNLPNGSSNALTFTYIDTTNITFTNITSTNVNLTNGTVTNLTFTYIDTTNLTFTNIGNLSLTLTNTFVSNWSAEIFVDDDAPNNSNDHFMPRTAVDPYTGIIACTWYDCRNDQGAGSRAITNVVKTNVTFSALSMITNVSISGAYNFYTTNGNSSNLTITLEVDNLTNTVMSSDTFSNVYIGISSNIDITLYGTNGGTTKVTVILTNVDTLAYTSGNAPNQEAIVYSTLSFDGGRSFQPNQQLNPANQNVVPPAVGVASGVAGSDSLSGWGHYTALAAYGANFFPAWADNSDVTTNNPDGANTNFDIYMLASAPGQTTVSVPVANLFVWVTNSPNPVVSAESIVYSVIVSNGGPKTAQPILITNILSPYVTLVPNGVIPALGGSYTTSQTPNGQEQLVFSFASLKNHGVLTNTFRVQATTSSIDTNFATVYSPLINLAPTNTSNTLITVVEGEDLAMGLTTSASNLLIGDTVVSWVTVTNLGPSTNGPVFITNTFSSNWGNVQVEAQGTNQVTNSSSGPIAIVNLGLLPVGQPVTAIFTAVVLTGTNSASESVLVTSQDVDTNLLNNSAAVTYYVNDESLAMGMTSSTSSVNLGQTITYQILVTNFGLSYSGLVTVSNRISTNLGQFSVTQSQGTCVIGTSNVVFNLGTLGAGEIATMTLTAVALSAPTSATNIAMVSSTDFNTNLANLVVTNIASVNGEDLAIGLTTTPASAQVGQTVTFAESVTNLGLAANGVVTVTNTFSTNFGSITVVQPTTGYTLNGSVVTINLGTLSSGQVVPVTITAVPTSIGTGTNTVGVGSLDFDPNLANNTNSTKVTITAALPMISNIVVSATPSSAVITFNTGFPGTAQVLYGTTTNYGVFTPISTTASTNHAFVLSGLTGGSNYDFEILAWVGSKLYTTNSSFTISSSLILGTENAIYQGLWNQGSGIPGIYGNTYQYSLTTNSTSPTAWAVYDPNIPASGLYNLYIWYPQNATFTTNAQVYVTGGTNEFVLSVNQTTNGGGWQPLATNMYFASGTNGTVILYNNTLESNKYLVANAMMWSYVTNQDYPTNGTVPAWWANLYFGTNVNGYVNGSADINGTGYTIFDDYVLGLNPTVGSPGLSFTLSPIASNVVSITFAPYQGGRAYQLEASTNLATWTTLTNAYTVSTNASATFTVAQTNSSSVFYRLSAQIVP